MTGQLVIREPRTAKAAVKAGEVFAGFEDGEKFSLTAIRHVGFARSMAVWEFECLCGRRVLRRATHVKHASTHPTRPSLRSILSCGCNPKARRWHGENKTEAWKYWQANREKLCQEWREDYFAFRDECFSKRLKGEKYLVRINTRAMIGPDNFAWCDITEKRLVLLERAVQVMLAEGMEYYAAWTRALSISRQRLHQITARWRPQRDKATQLDTVIEKTAQEAKA